MSTKAEVMLAFAREQLSELYDIGDHGPDLWDCSGLTMEMVELIGLKWTHSSHAQWYNNIKKSGDFSKYGEISTLPPGEFALLFKYGQRTSGKGMGMIHVGVYDGKTGHQIQAGGNGKKVYVNGKRKSTVSEDPFTPKYWTHWAHVKGQDDEMNVSEARPVVVAKPTDTSDLLTVRTGNKNEYVALAQTLLNKSGADPQLEVDGIFGKLTKAAVIDFQKKMGLKQDGVVGSKTWAVLYPQDAVPEKEDTYTVTIPDCTLVRANAILGVYKSATMTLQK